MEKQLKARVYPRIWAKTLKGDKITRDYLLTLTEPFDETKLFEYVCEITHAMDIPTPVILQSHTYHFVHFNVARFRPRDFVDDVDFDFFTLESATGTAISPLPKYFDENN